MEQLLALVQEYADAALQSGAVDDRFNVHGGGDGGTAKPAAASHQVAVSTALLMLLQRLNSSADEATATSLRHEIDAKVLELTAAPPADLGVPEPLWRAIVLKLHQVLLLPRVLDVLHKVCRSAINTSHDAASSATDAASPSASSSAAPDAATSSAAGATAAAAAPPPRTLAAFSSPSFTSLVRSSEESKPTSWSKLEAQQQKLRQVRLEEGTAAPGASSSATSAASAGSRRNSSNNPLLLPTADEQQQQQRVPPGSLAGASSAAPPSSVQSSPYPSSSSSSIGASSSAPASTSSSLVSSAGTPTYPSLVSAAVLATSLDPISGQPTSSSGAAGSASSAPPTHKELTATRTSDPLLPTTIHDSLDSGADDALPARHQVPYADHQIVFPASYFRYHQKPTHSVNLVVPFNELPLPEWLSFSLLASDAAEVPSGSTTLVLPLSAIAIAAFACGRLDSVIEATVGRQIVAFCSSAVVRADGSKDASAAQLVIVLEERHPQFSFAEPSHAFRRLSALSAERRQRQWSEQHVQQFCSKWIAAYKHEAQQQHAMLERLKDDIEFLLQINDAASLEYTEQVLIALLGDPNAQAREVAVKYLNIIYDGHEWQRTKALEVKIRCLRNLFVVELPWTQGPNVPRGLLVQVSAPNAFDRKRRSFITNYRPTLNEDRLVVDLLRYTGSGYYDFRFGTVDAHGTFHVLEGVEQATGRFIVHPEARDEVFHEVFVDLEGVPYTPGPIHRRGTFDSIARAIPEYSSYNVSVIYVMGALDRANFGFGQPFAPIDRASPNRASGGKEAFHRLVEQANRAGMKLVVDATTRLSVQGAHRKYRFLTCHALDEKGMAHVCLGSDGLEHQWNDSVLLNYRRKETWDLFVHEIGAWAEAGAKGIRIDSAHCSPLILRPNLDELLRLDSDTQLHYSESEIFHGDIVLPFSNEAVQYGVFGTQAFRNEAYPNPFFVKTTSTLWRTNPSFLVLAEVYWDREINAIVSGLIPYSSGLPRSLASVFGTGLTKDGTRMQLSQRQSVKAFYDWYELERMRFPQNSILLYGSSHYTPYPTAMYGAGAWAAVDLMFLLPEVPITFVGEQAGWTMSVDISSCEFRGPARQPPQQQIRGHYVHRAKLRRQYSVLRDGGMILLYAKYDQLGWHERVFAFARFKYNTMAIVAINFNDVDSVFYIDMAPLANVCDDDYIYKRADLIDPTRPPVYFSLHELLAEKQFVELKPFEALCWGISREVDSASNRRVLFEHSMRRLHAILDGGKDPSHNLVYSKLTAALALGSVAEFDRVVQELQQHLTPSLHELFPQLLQRALHHMTLPPELALNLAPGTTSSSPAAAAAVAAAAHPIDGRAVLALVRRAQLEAHERRDLRAQMMARLYNEILQRNTLGPLVFVTPEIGRFSTVGGIGVMVDELTQDLVSLGCDITVISPYYNFNRHGKTGYLEDEGIEYQGSMLVHMGNESLKVGYHLGVENGVKYYFLHHFDYFPTPYHAGSPTHQLKSIVLIAKASLELCCQLQILPAVVITNDWFTGLVPAYGSVRSGAFGTVFSGSTFFHLVHNLEVGYEGKIYLEGYDDLSYIHNLPRELIIDPTVSGQLCVNASRCALLTSTNWGTVSLSYRQDLLTGGINPSPLRPLLCSFPRPFAHSNGIRVAKRRELIAKVAPSHAVGKRMLQEKYFGAANPAVPVLSFVGRICEQKGVHLILNTFERLYNVYGGRVQVIVGGMANKKDTYAAECAWKMRAFRHRYPNSFWADPDAFFTDGPLLNIGSDYALMPSLFEPSGVVQQEYFAAGTPVIAFKTGGLKDTVHEYSSHNPAGNGFTFESHDYTDFVNAVGRAVSAFSIDPVYEAIRKNAAASVLDTKVVAEEWAKEFARLRKVIWTRTDPPPPQITDTAPTTTKEAPPAIATTATTTKEAPPATATKDAPPATTTKESTTTTASRQ